MCAVKLNPNQKPLQGSISIPGDKSISHRSIILGSLAKGRTEVTNFLDGEDCMRTIVAFQAMGVAIEKKGTTITIESGGLKALQEPLIPLDFGNSGTTARLMIGLLAGLPFFSTIYGDAYLTKRPMNRVIVPLKQMGAEFAGRSSGTLLPLAIKGRALTGMTYEMPLKSAQVKSAVLLAGLLANGSTTVIEETKTRDHTERMLAAFGADISTEGNAATITNKKELIATDVYVPGDISSAAFFLVAAAIVPDSKLTLEKVGLNETRTGIIDVLEQMGANIVIDNIQTIGGEKFGDITVSYGALKSIEISGDIIPRLIDEIPVIALLASQAEGTTIIRDAEELRVKETDRIEAVVDVLSTLGIHIEATNDGMKIHGKAQLTGGNIASYNDHRIAMMGAIASLIASEPVVIDDTSSIAISYPNFFEHLDQVTN